MSLDQLRMPIFGGHDWGAVIGSSWAPHRPWLTNDEKIVVLPFNASSAGRAFGIVVHDPSDPTSGEITTFGLPTLLSTFGSGFRWPIFVPATNELWAFWVQTDINTPSGGFTTYRLEALIIDCDTMLATRQAISGLPDVVAQTTPTATRENNPYNFWGLCMSDETTITAWSHDALIGGAPKHMNLVHIDVETRTGSTTPSILSTISESDLRTEYMEFIGGLYVRICDIGSTGVQAYAHTLTADGQTEAFPALAQYETFTGRHSWPLKHDGTVYWGPNNGTTYWQSTSDGVNFQHHPQNMDGPPFFFGAGNNHAVTLHVGPSGKIYAPPCLGITGQNPSLLTLDPDTGETGHFGTGTVGNPGSATRGFVMCANGNFFGPTTLGQWLCGGFREDDDRQIPFPPDASTAPQPVRQWGPAGAGVCGARFKPAALDPPFILIRPETWDGGWWIYNEGTGGDWWDMALNVQGDTDANTVHAPGVTALTGWFETEELHLFAQRGWRGSFSDPLTDHGYGVHHFGGWPSRGVTAKPMTIIFCFGTLAGRGWHDAYTELNQSGNFLWVRISSSSPRANETVGGEFDIWANSSTLTMNVDDNNNFSQAGLPFSPDLRNRMLVMTVDWMSGGMNVWIDGQGFHAPDMVGTNPYIFPNGDEIDMDQTMQVDIPSDRTGNPNFEGASSIFMEVNGGTVEVGQPHFGVPWTGYHLCAYARGYPSKADMAYYYQLAYPGRALPPDLQ